METYEFTIDAASTDIGTRLDKYLTEQILTNRVRISRSC